MKLIAILAAVNTLLVSEAVIANNHQHQQSFDGTLRIGKQYSYIFYFGEQSGDTVVYFFQTNSAVGRKIRSVCRNNRYCSATGSLQIQNSHQIPKGIPESTSGTYRVTSVSATSSRSQTSNRR
ncbi:hypothetical protein [Anabaena azotica]|uniref:Uncharacterized protein n=1 Tax=Anabaena azotica FACHB-119 TaxID=947527 RepID=A0ABR8CXS8_9NOST|nr:hypothetical protein [Anabaena azotica]MBD2499471.1 hypothetical protein [Anabaena azotica FACHB-119]